MRFEHLVEVNDPADPNIAPLSRERLWRGLVMRAERPQLSVIGLDACEILERDEDAMRRELRFGALRVRDRVRLKPMESVTYYTEATADVPPSSLEMAIEEPEQGHLFVRFTYTDLGPAAKGAMDDFVEGHRRQAYLHADIDTIATIRRLAEEGLLVDLEK